MINREQQIHCVINKSMLLDAEMKKSLFYQEISDKRNITNIKNPISRR